MTGLLKTRSRDHYFLVPTIKKSLIPKFDDIITDFIILISNYLSQTVDCAFRIEILQIRIIKNKDILINDFICLFNY